MKRIVGALVLVYLACAPARATEPSELARLFPFEADVFVGSRAGLSRLVLPSEIFQSCRPELSDLRLFDAGGHEMPFAVDAGTAEGQPATLVETTPAKVLDVRRVELRSENAPTLYRETYQLAAPAAHEDAGWDLVFETARPRFVRRLRITAPDAGVLIDDASLFRLPNVPQDRTRVTLPPLDADRLTVVLEGEDGYLEPTLAWSTSAAVGALGRATVPLVEARRDQANGRTVVELTRPRGLVPELLRVETTTGSFDRTIEVWDVAPGRQDALLARGTLVRIQALATVESREVALGPARGERLRVEIVDGDSPQLDGLAFTAAVREPAIVFFTTAATEDAPAATLRYGGGRAFAPHYDLARLVPSTGSGEAVRLGALARIRDPKLPRARLGAVRTNPLFVGTPALDFAMRPGVEIDARVYGQQRSLDLAPSYDGLSRFRLAPEDLARARPDLADVRIVDGQRRQWAYLIERGTASESVSLEVGAVERGPRGSRYVLHLPATPFALDGVTFDTAAPFFDRPFRVVGMIGERKDVPLAGGRLSRAPGQAQPPLTALFAPVRVDALALEVTDGDDPPLAFAAATARAQVADVYVVAPAGRYRLLLGHPDADTPHYELGRTRDVVLSVGSNEARLGPLGANPEYSARARLTTGGGAGRALPQAILWTVLVAGVAVLTLITLRAAREEPPA